MHSVAYSFLLLPYRLETSVFAKFPNFPNKSPYAPYLSTKSPILLTKA